MGTRQMSRLAATLASYRRLGQLVEHLRLFQDRGDTGSYLARSQVEELRYLLAACRPTGLCLVLCSFPAVAPRDIQPERLQNLYIEVHSHKWYRPNHDELHVYIPLLRQSANLREVVLQRRLDDTEMSMLTNLLEDGAACPALKKLTVMGTDYQADTWIRLQEVCSRRGTQVLPCPTRWR